MESNNKAVYQAICGVQGELCREGIAKDRKNQSQGWFFRGIDDMYNALAPLLSKYGLCILPRVLTRECVERATFKGGVMFYTVVTVEFDFVASADGSSHCIRTVGEAMDSGDKSCNKAMSAAYKYAVMQAFCIPTEGDNDADASSPEVKPVNTVGTGLGTTVKRSPALPSASPKPTASSGAEYPESTPRELPMTNETAATVVSVDGWRNAICPVGKAYTGSKLGEMPTEAVSWLARVWSAKEVASKPEYVDLRKALSQWESESRIAASLPSAPF